MKIFVKLLSIFLSSYNSVAAIVTAFKFEYSQKSDITGIPAGEESYTDCNKFNFAESEEITSSKIFIDPSNIPATILGFKFLFGIFLQQLIDFLGSNLFTSSSLKLLF